MTTSHLNSDDDDLEQLQAQFEGLAPLGVELVAGAHEEVLQLPAECLLLFLVGAQPAPRCRG